MPKYQVTVKDIAYQTLEVEAQTMEKAADKAMESHEIFVNIGNRFEVSGSSVVEQVINTETNEAWEETSSFSGQLAPVSTNDTD